MDELEFQRRRAKILEEIILNGLQRRIEWINSSDIFTTIRDQLRYETGARIGLSHIDMKWFQNER